MNQSLRQRVHAQADYIFRELFPKLGQTIREGQIRLCHIMLDALFDHRIALCDAGVGIGKSYAYLVAGVLWREALPVTRQTPIVISTSSIALQEALLRDYIPFLSVLLLDHDLIRQPLFAVVRKGKEHFVCDSRLAERLRQLQNSSPRNYLKLQTLGLLLNTHDMDAVPNLAHFDRRLICVPSVCPRGCAVREHCHYQNYLKRAMSADVDIQICNHNYLLADTIHRTNELHPLLRDFGALVVDEAHKLPEAAQQMYSKKLDEDDFALLVSLLEQEHFTQIAQQLRMRFQALLDSLTTGWRAAETAYIETPERTTTINDACRSIQQTIKSLQGQLPQFIIHRLEDTFGFLRLFLLPSLGYVLYIRYDLQGKPALLAASKQVPFQLERGLWQQERPVILTSGTLSIGDDFQRNRQRLGIGTEHPTVEITLPSPFDYRANSLLYLPCGVPPRPGSAGEVAYLTDQIRRLVDAANGHALVLFTSYRLMAAVYESAAGSIGHKLMLAWRGGHRVIEEFKREQNAVLFAAGSCWEGIDFPGDMVSLLIIPRLPFPTPDPISRAEQEEYPSLQEYLRAVIVPDTQRVLRQGVGRAIRLETDTCVIALLDSRAQPAQKYHEAAMAALPPCPRTDSLEVIKQFIRARKGPDYFFEGYNG